MAKTILIVDDEECIRFVFDEILRKEGYDVITASDYSESLVALTQTCVDLVITDIILHGHSGIDLLTEIKNRNLECPVIMITGEPNIETSMEAVRLGAFDYIPKPIHRDTLIKSVRLALRQKELIDRKNLLEKENRKVRNNVEAILGSIEEGIITVDEYMRVVEMNSSAETLCGLSSDHARGKSLESQLSLCQGGCLEFLKKTLDGHRSIHEAQIKCGHRGKAEQIVSLRSTPLKSDGIDFKGAVLVVRNVTRLASLEKELKQRDRFHRLVGKNSRMLEIYNLVENLSDTDTTVLITGESGTGKELVAHAIHNHSLRKGKAFVTVNCSALSENLLESELFGHVRGAFTGAVRDKKGRFELADQGTLFIDEIGDISPLIQLKLLRVLQEKEFERVGDSTPIQTHVRVVAATNRNLIDLVQSGRFREDLYYRIKVVVIALPPLRERRDDIPILADHFIKRFNERFSNKIKELSNEVMEVFMAYSWPGNIREFEHAIEHAFVICRGEVICVEHLPIEIRTFNSFKEDSANREKKTVTKESILKALTKAGWNKSKAARLMGIGRRTIYRKIDEFGITEAVE